MISLNQYLRGRFGCKVYKLALCGGTTCPNRDGTLDTRGCIFCSGGSGDFAEPVAETVYQQIELAKLRVANKAGTSAKYIAYFQDYTGTYAPIEKLYKNFSEAVAHPDIVAVSIATRPDCLPANVMELLAELNRMKPIWVELGLQTIHERTAEYIRRGYPLETYDAAVEALHACGLEVITHMILGLPGETVEDMAATAEHISNIGSEGIKLQLLHVLHGTDLEAEYLAGKFDVLTLEEYITALKACLAKLRPDIVIHRLTGDGNKKELVAPLWSADKKSVLAEINTKVL